MESSNDFTFGEPSSIGTQVISIILLSIYFLCFLIFGTIAFQRRHHRLLAPRSVITLLLMMFHLLFFMVAMVISFFIGKPPVCTAMVVFILSGPGFAIHFNLLSPTVVITNELRIERMDYVATNMVRTDTKEMQSLVVKEMNDDSVSNRSNKMRWYRRMHRLLDLKYRLLLGVLAVLIELVVFLPFYLRLYLQGDCLRTALAASDVWLVFIGLSGVFFGYKQQSVKDPLYFKGENLLQMFTFVPYTIIVLLYPWCLGSLPIGLTFAGMPLPHLTPR